MAGRIHPNQAIFALPREARNARPPLRVGGEDPAIGEDPIQPGRVDQLLGVLRTMPPRIGPYEAFGRHNRDSVKTLLADDRKSLRDHGKPRAPPHPCRGERDIGRRRAGVGWAIVRDHVERTPGVRAIGLGNRGQRSEPAKVASSSGSFPRIRAPAMGSA